MVGLMNLNLPIMQKEFRMKRIFYGAILSLLIISFSWAYIPEKTYVYQEGTIIKNSELNQNEDDFFNAITDGRADLIIKSVSTNLLSSNTFTYRSVQTINKYISFSEFGQVTNSASVYVPQHNIGVGRIVAVTPNFIVAPVIFPNGSVITSIVPSADYWVNITLNRVAQNTSNISVVGFCSGTTNASSLTNTTVDNTGYSYFLTAQTTSANKALQYVKITYTNSTLRMD